MILGLTGSLGSGKSTVAQMLISLCNAPVIDADQIVRDLQQPGRVGYQAIIKEFGDGVTDSSGNLDRRKLAALVFGDAARLQRLNAIIHPLVWDEQARQLEQHRAQPLVVLMVPLLYETGADALCDKVAVVTLDEPERERRVSQRDNLTPEEIRSRLGAQMAQDDKQRRSDFVINNNGSLEATRQQVLDMLKQLNVAPAATSPN